MINTSFNYSCKPDFYKSGQKGTYYMYNNNKTVGIANYPDLLQQISALLNLSLPEIKKKYADYPHCLMDYFEQGIKEKSIEIRFDQKEITITCLFDDHGKCQFVFLFPDKNELIEEFILFLKETYNYDFLWNRWIVSGYYIKVKEVSLSYNDVRLMLYCD